MIEVSARRFEVVSTKESAPAVCSFLMQPKVGSIGCERKCEKVSNNKGSENKLPCRKVRERQFTGVAFPTKIRDGIVIENFALRAKAAEKWMQGIYLSYSERYYFE